MPNITLTFANDINTSAQIGDVAYFCSTINSAEFKTGDNIKRIGKIKKIEKNASNNWEMTCGYGANLPLPSDSDFIMFSKDNEVNTSSALGYYAEVRFVNNSTVKSELFATACNVFISSK